MNICIVDHCMTDLRFLNAQALVLALEGPSGVYNCTRTAAALVVTAANAHTFCVNSNQ